MCEKISVLNRRNTNVETCDKPITVKVKHDKERLICNRIPPPKHVQDTIWMC